MLCFKQFLTLFLLCSFFSLSLQAASISTFYGDMEIDEPILLDLINSPALQRLKKVHQYGVSSYTTHRERYFRYDHSLGVMAILRKNGASLEEQISGLLHDVSHTAFSHVGDWVFPRENREDSYHETIFELFLACSGLEKLLHQHGYSVAQISPKNPKFIMLEQPLPALCADRIDYNIQGAYYQGFIEKEEVLLLYNDLHFSQGAWWGSNKELFKKLTEFSIFMTEDCWGSADNYLTSAWFAQAIKLAIEHKMISWYDFHFGYDQEIWEKLYSSEETSIKKLMDKVTQPFHLFEIVSPEKAQMVIPFKCRAIDPLIKKENKLVPLSSICPSLAAKIERIRLLAKQGWPVKMAEGEALF